MKERPILMSAPMVRALLDGSKTMTRRIVKPQAESRTTEAFQGADGIWRFSYPTARGQVSHADWDVRCPYGQPGDRLWVRETFQAHFEDEISTDRPRGPRHTMGIPSQPDRKSFVYYRADGEIEHQDMGKSCWMPSIYLPRKYSRIALEITGVRVERLQDINVEDAIAEGLKAITKDGKLIKYGIPDIDGLPGTDDTGWPWHDWFLDPRGAYRKLWESINGAGSWDANPWVWVLEFRRVTNG